VLFVASGKQNTGETEDANRHTSSQLVTVRHFFGWLCSLIRADIQRLIAGYSEKVAAPSQYMSNFTELSSVKR